MENLNNVPSTGTFGNSVQKINSNFDLIVNAINSLEYQTTRSKGILNYGQNPATVFPNAVAGDWCMILSQGNVFPATIKTYNGSTWSGSGTWNPEGLDLTGYAKTTDMNTAIANSLAQATARMGYGECTVNGTSLSVSIPNFTLPTSGGTIHIKMSAVGTGASTLNINSTGAKTLWYNGAAVSAQNTWGAGEIISAFYDGTRYMSSNSQGGGGKAEKIIYDNSQSGLASDNVQGAVNEIYTELTELARNLSESKTETITASNGLVVIGAGKAMNSTTGELISNNYYTTYEYDLTQYQHIDSIKYWAYHGSTVVGLFALFQEDTLLYITSTNADGASVNIRNYSTATKIRISTYVAQRAAKIEITSHTEPISYDDIAKTDDLDKLKERLGKNAYTEITASGMTVLGNYAMNSSTGELVSNTNFTCYEYDITQLGTPISIKWWANRGSSTVGTFALFDGDTLLYISTTSSASGTIYNVPEIYQNATKVRLSTYTTSAKLQITYYITVNIDAFESVAKKAEDASIAADVTTALMNVNIFKVPAYKNYINKNDLLYGKTIASGNYVDKNTGVFSNKIYIKSGTTVTTSGIKPMSAQSFVYLAFFNSSDVYLGRETIALNDATNRIATFAIPSTFNYSYFRVLLRNGSEDYSLAQLELGTEATAYVGDYAETYEFRDAESDTVKPTILLMGASYAYNGNAWFDRACSMLGCSGTNKAFSGAVIYDMVTAIKNRTLYTIATLDNYDILAIMHVYNYDVCDETNLMTVADYETKIDADGASSLTRSQAFDYVIKKYQTDCYNQKDNTDSKWYQSPYGKPPIIVINTSWHDNRTIYNNSVRLLAAKWGLTLVEFDKNIGFSSSGLHPVTGAQQSLLYAVDSAGGYGHHPLRAANPDGSTQYIQMRMAAIFAKYVKFLVDTVKGYKV